MTDNVFLQENADVKGTAAAWSDLAGPPAAERGRLWHAVNFYRVGSALDAVQQITAQSMLAAKRNAGVEIGLLSVALEGEQHVTPEEFLICAPLGRTVQSIRAFSKPRPLPLLFDILRAAAASATDGYLIFTNSDICLAPDFYRSVLQLLELGADALVINRRTADALSAYGAHPFLAALEVGKRHPGFDCFVFPAVWVERFIASDSCIGMPYVMRPLLYNLVAQADRLLIMKSAHLTYHFGDDMPGKTPELADYAAHNEAEAIATLNHLCKTREHRRRLEAFCAAHPEPFRPAQGGVPAVGRQS